MHMPLVAKLQLHLAGKDATWSDDGATWNEPHGKQLLVACDGPLTGEQLIDAHLRARALGAKLTIAHTGSPSAVALRTAARFGIALLDAAALAEPEAGAYAPAPAPPATPGAGAHAPPALAAPEPQPLLPAPELPAPPAPLAVEPAAPVLPELPAPAVAPEPAEEPDTPLPWDPSLQAPEVAPAHVEPIELLAMPWAHEGEHVEVLDAGRTTRPLALRPTQAPDWGLPWPRPTAPMDGVAKVDPKLWQVPERIAAVREDLERAGATSLGAVRPEGSAWLKRITEFGGA